MNKTPHTAPYLNGKAFNCPHCGAYAKQDWSAHWDTNASEVRGLETSKCAQCNEYAIWRYGTLLFPQTSPVEAPSGDLPADVKCDYEEAAQIVRQSPRAAAALLRLAIQKLCKHLGGNGENINDDIANLVKDGLPVKVQQMLDTVRVVGNHSVHAGVIDLNDNPQTSETLFRLINKIAEIMITDPKELELIYSGLPEKDRENIEKRDGSK